MRRANLALIRVHTRIRLNCSHGWFSCFADIVNLDITTYNAGGYHGDLNETFCVGNVDADGRRVVRTAFECLAAALELVKPGTLYRDLGTVIERHAKQNNCSVVRTYCGHGIGKELFHTIPNIAHVSTCSLHYKLCIC